MGDPRSQGPQGAGGQAGSEVTLQVNILEGQKCLLAVPGEGSAVETHTGSPSHVPLHTQNSWLSSAGCQMKSHCLCFGTVSHEDSLSSKMLGYKCSLWDNATTNLEGAGIPPDVFMPGTSRLSTSMY